MVVSAQNQRIAKRNSHNRKPVFKLIVNPHFKTKKKSTLSGLFSFIKKMRPVKNEKRKKSLLTLSLFLSILVVLWIVGAPIFSQDKELKEFVFPENQNTLFNSLYDQLLVSEVETTPQRQDSAVIRSLKTSVYKVKSGDTLSGIAKHFGLNMGTIISFNKINNARSLGLGTKLTIPNYNGLLYKVKTGDSLNLISKRYNISLNNLLDWNNLETSVLKKNQILFLPGAELSTKELNDIIGQLFIYPTLGRLTSGFGWRNSPFTGVREMHRGIDLANAIGTKIIAAREGRVTKTGYDTIYGNFIIISHNDGFHTLYGHLKTIYVAKGSYVKQGQKIASMGISGLTTGSHLHFSIFKNGKAINPLIYLK
jgi:murein DD-endopeptidase MepM/ murein hydrolase activator NlpD